MPWRENVTVPRYIFSNIFPTCLGIFLLVSNIFRLTFLRSWYFHSALSAKFLLYFQTLILKPKCLETPFPSSNACDWGHIANAWNILYDFVKPRMSPSLIEKLQIHLGTNTFDKWVKDKNFPKGQLQNLALIFKERNKMLRSICFHIADSDLEAYETVLTSVKPPRDSEEVEDDPAHTTEDNSKPPRKRALHQRKHEPLPDTTKIYFMEEGKQDTRTGIMVTLLSNMKPKDGKVDIKTLLWGNETRHLAKQSIFDKKKHQLFYPDLENHKVRMNIDSCASFRSAVEEMHIHGKSKHSIQFYFRPKDEETRLVFCTWTLKLNEVTWKLINSGIRWVLSS